MNKPKITVTMADGTKRTYDSVEDWRTKRRAEMGLKPNGKSPVSRKSKEEVKAAAEKYAEELRLAKKTAATDNPPHTVTEAGALTEKFRKLSKKKRCPDCGKKGKLRGHQSCPTPSRTDDDE